MKTCTACASPFDLTDGVCVCNGLRYSDHSCIDCPDNSIILDDGTCGCAFGYYEVNGVCTEATVDCGDGMYNDG